MGLAFGHHTAIDAVLDHPITLIKLAGTGHIFPIVHERSVVFSSGSTWAGAGFQAIAWRGLPNGVAVRDVAAEDRETVRREADDRRGRRGIFLYE